MQKLQLAADKFDPEFIERRRQGLEVRVLILDCKHFIGKIIFSERQRILKETGKFTAYLQSVSKCVFYRTALWHTTKFLEFRKRVCLKRKLLQQPRIPLEFFCSQKIRWFVECP